MYMYYDSTMPIFDLTTSDIEMETEVVELQSQSLIGNASFVEVEEDAFDFADDVSTLWDWVEVLLVPVLFLSGVCGNSLTLAVMQVRA